MTEGPGAKDAPPTLTDEERAPGQDVLSGMTELERRETLAWVGEHLPQVRRSVFDQRLLYWSLGIASVVGLAAHAGGYLLKASVTTEPLGLVADLLYERVDRGGGPGSRHDRERRPVGDRARGAGVGRVILIGSWVGDLIGRKRAYVLGLLGYAVGALAMALDQGLGCWSPSSTTTPWRRSRRSGSARPPA